MNDVPASVTGLAVILQVIARVFTLEEKKAEHLELVVRQFLERESMPTLAPSGFHRPGVEFIPCLVLRDNDGPRHELIPNTSCNLSDRNAYLVLTCWG
jgi:hypothetical protein